MSKAFREKYGNKKVNRQEIREFTSIKYPTNPDGSPIYITEQGHKDECDVNNIIKKYDATGLITHVAKFEASYQDVSAIEFKQALELQMEISAKFSELPSEIRKRFENNPQLYLAFLENPKNDKEAVTLGLRRGDGRSPINAEPSKLQKGTPVPENK